MLTGRFFKVSEQIFFEAPFECYQVNENQLLNFMPIFFWFWSYSRSCILGMRKSKIMTWISVNIWDLSQGRYFGWTRRVHWICLPFELLGKSQWRYAVKVWVKHISSCFQIRYNSYYCIYLYWYNFSHIWVKIIAAENFKDSSCKNGSSKNPFICTVFLDKIWCQIIMVML